MLLRRALLFIGILIAIGAALSGADPARAQNPCEGLVAPRLTAGGAARVIAAYGLSLKDRAATGAAGSTEVAQMAYGTVARVTEGPTCAFGFRWWQLQLPNGTVGFAAEGSSGSEYFMEPYTDALHVFHRADDGATLLDYVVTPDGKGELFGRYTITPRTNTPQTVWQQVEIDWLGQALETLRQQCPDRLAGTDLGNAGTLEAALQLPLPALEYEFYPAPSGNPVVFVQHEHLRVPRCDNVVPERAGISTVSIGLDEVLFPFPQHGSVPESVEVYKGGDPTEWNVTLDEVVVSPQQKHIAFVAAYRYPCNRQDCYRFHLYVFNRETRQLYVLGEGRHVAWSSNGERISFFRLLTGADGTTSAHLYTARPDGTDRQEVWLPGGAVYVSDSRQPLGFPWNSSGTRVMVGNAGVAEVMMFDLADRSFTTPVLVPDTMPQANRLAVHPIQGDKVYWWVTIRGDSVLQNARTGDWTPLNSSVAAMGVPPVQARPFALGDRGLIEMADGSAYILDLNADTLTPVTFEG